MRILFSFLLFIPSLASQAWSDQHALVHQEILRLNYFSAQSEIQKGLLKEPRSPDFHYLNGLNAAVRYMVEADPEFTSTYEDVYEDAVDEIEEHETSRALAQSAELEFLHAFMAFKNGSYFTAAYCLYHVAGMVEDLEEAYPKAREGFPVRIAMEIMMASLPEEMQSYLALIGMEGSIHKANQLLDDLIASLHKSPDQSLTFYAVFMANFYTYQLKVEPPQNMGSLQAKLEHHPLILAMKAMSYGLNYRNKEALKVLATLKGVKTELPLCYLDYLEGRCKMQNLDPSADQCFIRYLKGYKGDRLIKASYLYLAWHSVLFRGGDGLATYREGIQLKGDKTSGPDALAYRLRENAFHADLVRSRLLFDGGDFKGSEAVLRELEPKDFHSSLDMIEWAYRLGRIGEETKRYEMAELYFRQAVEMPKVSGDYMQPNACLKLGKLYLGSNKKSKAQYYLELSLEYDDYPYASTIRRDAKTELARID